MASWYQERARRRRLANARKARAQQTPKLGDELTLRELQLRNQERIRREKGDA